MYCKMLCLVVCVLLVGCEVSKRPPITMTMKTEEHNGEFKSITLDFPDMVHLYNKEQVEGAIDELENVVRSLRAVSERLPTPEPIPVSTSKP